MTKNTPTYLCTALFFLILLCHSCSPGKVSNPVLLRADSLMEHRPDSALALLNGIDHPQNMKKAERAFYALLLTKAADKNYIAHTSDSLIKTAFDYYQRYGSRHQEMESLYYLASVYRDLGDAPRAIDYFRQVAETSKSKTEHALLCQTYLQTGTLFFYQGLPKEGVEAYKKSYQHAQQSNDSMRLADGYIIMARVYAELNNVDSTLYYYKKAVDIARAMQNMELEDSAESELASIYLQLSETERAQKLLTNKKRDEVDFLNWGDLHKQSNQLDSAKHYYRKVISTGGLYTKENASKKLYELEKSLEHTGAALHHLEQFCAYRDSVQEITNIEAVKRVESLYAYQHITKENNQLQLKNKQKEHIILGITLVFCFFLLWLSLHFRQKRRYQEEQILRISSFKQQQLDGIAEKPEEITTRKEKHENLFHSLSLAICGKMNQPSFKLTDEEWNKLQTEADAAYGFTTRLRLLCPTISEMELHVSLLIKAEIPPSGIANIVCRSKSNITNVRKRLYEKTHGVNNGKAEQWDEFILSL